MTNEEYFELLKTTPDHNSEDFLDFLKKHNKIVWENQRWLIIENCKYEGWRTAFSKDPEFATKNLHEILDQYPECEWHKKHINKQTIKRFHIHLISEVKK